MDNKHKESRIPAYWVISHIVSVALIFIKFLGGIPDCPWWIVIAPFIFDCTLVVCILAILWLFYIYRSL